MSASRRHEPPEPSAVVYDLLAHAVVRRPIGRVWIGEPPTEPPGWWVCPSCGRRIDRVDEPRRVVARYCTGGSRGEPGHASTAMEVRR